MSVNRNSELGLLSDPDYYTTPLNIKGCAPQALRSHLWMMMLIRRVEEVIGDLVVEGEARCPCHLGIGQEAIPAGISAHLRATDRVFGAHRSHGHYLALGGSVDQLMAEILGKESGCSKGMGGSMHLYGADCGFFGSVPIVAGTIPIAVGAALAAKKDGGDNIAVSYLGDGSSEEGGFHESLNLASIYKLPTLFVCENNLFASHMDILLRQPSDRVSRYAEAHRIQVRLVDGNDVVAVANAARELIDSMRVGGGPGFLETVTYRWRGHVGPNEDEDVGVQREAEDIAAWKLRDPVRRLRDTMVTEGLLDKDNVTSLEIEVKDLVNEALNKAKAAPYPRPEALLDMVYARVKR